MTTNEMKSQEIRELVHRPRIGLEQDRVDAILPIVASELSAKLSSFGQEQRPIYGEVVVHAAKQQFGFIPTLSPDFDILHRYFFPARQSKTDTIDARSVERVLELFPGDILLLPGTLSELIRYINETYKLQIRIQKRLERHTNEQGLEQLLEMLKTDDFDASWIDLEPLARNVVTKFVEVSKALDRMRRFLTDKRIIPLNTLIDLDQYKEICKSEEFADLQSRLQGKRSAEEHSTSTRKSFNDASNLFVAMELHRILGSPDAKIQRNIMFLSGTKILKRIPREFFVDDALISLLIEKRIVLADHAGYMERPYGWRPVALDAIEEFCILNQAFSSHGEIVNEAINLFRDIFRISGFSVEVFGLKSHSDLPDRTRSALRTVIPAYLRDCWRTSNRRTSRLSSREWQRRFDGTVSPRALTDQVQTGAFDTERELLNLGIEVIRQQHNVGRMSECIGLTALSPYTADVILVVEQWTHYGFVSVQFSSDLTATEIVEFLNEFGREHRNVEGELAAWFEMNYAEMEPISNFVQKFTFSLMEKRKDGEQWNLESEHANLIPMIPLSMIHSVSLEDFAFRSLARGDTLRPERVSILSELGDLHIDMPWSRGTKLSVSGTFHLKSDFEALFENTIRKLHSWRSNHRIMKFLTDGVKNLVNFSE